MADPARRLMTPEEFFAWQLHQEERYELVDGLPIRRHRMMTGSSTQHHRVSVNIIASLHTQLRGSGCRPMTADIAIRTGIHGLRRPDVRFFSIVATTRSGRSRRSTASMRSSICPRSPRS